MEGVITGLSATFQTRPVGTDELSFATQASCVWTDPLQNKIGARYCLSVHVLIKLPLDYALTEFFLTWHCHLKEMDRALR